MSKEKLHRLTIKKDASGYELMIDDKKLHHVEEYKITKSSTTAGTAELLVKILVKYP